MTPSDTEQLLQQAFNLAKSGQRTEARKILSQLVKDDPRNARAWYVLSQVVEPIEQKTYCLKKVLEIDPANPKATEQLAKLQQIAFLDLPVETEIVTPQAPKQTSEIDQTPSQSPQNNVNRFAVVLIGLIALAAVVYFAIIVPQVNQVKRDLNNIILNGGNSPGSNSGSSFDSYDASYIVTYRVEGKGSAMVTYYNAQGGTEQISSVKLPWETAVNMKKGSFASLVAQNKSSGSISCQIKVDGVVAKQSESSGQFVVVTCADWLGMDD